MDPGNVDQSMLAREINSQSEIVRASSEIISRLELKVDALCQVLSVTRAPHPVARSGPRGTLVRSAHVLAPHGVLVCPYPLRAVA